MKIKTLLARGLRNHPRAANEEAEGVAVIFKDSGGEVRAMKVGISEASVKSLCYHIASHEFVHETAE